MALVVLVAAPFLMRNMLVSSSLRAARTSRDLADATMLLAHAAMAAALMLAVVSRTARSLIIEKAPEPLAVYPGGRRGLATYHLWGEVATTGLWLIGFFYLFYGPLVYDLAPRPTLALPMHLIAQALVFCALGALAYRITLWTLESRPSVGRSLYSWASAGAILAFLGMAASAAVIEDLPRGGLEGSRAWVSAAAGAYPPLGALGRSVSSFPSAVTWLTGVVLAGTVASITAVPLSRRVSPLLLGDLEGLLHPRFKSVFGGRGRAGGGARLFFLKDLWLPAVRHPRRVFTRHWVLLAIALTGPVLTWQLRREGRVSEIVAAAALWGVVMAVPSLAAYLNGLGALGREGAVSALIRPVLRPAALWGCKVQAVLVAVVPQGLVYGAITGWSATKLGLEPGPLEAAGAGALAGLVASTNAVGLGFLIPDFRRRSLLTPGASRSARRLFEALAVYGIASCIAVRIMTRTGVLPPTLFPVSVATTAGRGLTLGGIVTLLALRRFPSLES